MDSVKLKIINLLLVGIRVVGKRLVFLKQKYMAEKQVGRMVKQQNFDMRNMGNRLKNVMLHDQEIIDKRWAECEKCEFLTPKTKQCQKCNCFMKMKTRVATASCPIGKWEKEYDFMKGKKVNGSQVTT